jgi:hypothetical protein
MNRRQFTKGGLLLGTGAAGNRGLSGSAQPLGDFYVEPARKLPVRKFDVVVVGGGTAGVLAAIASARQGAKTVLIECKGYPGGAVTEGGTTLHSFFNVWRAFPGVRKRQVIKGIPQEIVDRLMKVGGCSGHGEQTIGDRDSSCTVVDTEMYKLVAFQMLVEAGVYVCVNTLLTGAIKDGSRIKGVTAESRSGREVFYARSFIDCTGYGDLAAYAGADYTEPNDYNVCNSFGMANVNIDKIHLFLKGPGAIREYAEGRRSGEENRIIRVLGQWAKLPPECGKEAKELGIEFATTTIHDNYLMFVKVNLSLPKSPTNRDAVAKAELQIRQRQYLALQLFKKWFPGCEKAFIARTAPCLNIRRGRVIACDHDMTHEDVIDARHFDDQVYVYSYHDTFEFKVKGGGTYGMPYKALRPRGIDNLLVAGMLITSDRRAHQSTRNTVSSMAQGQAVGTAAALCALRNRDTRELPYGILRDALVKGGVYFEG